jgi:hypothetical protein
MEQRVPKRRRVKFRPRGITQKKEYKKYYIFGVCICSLIYPARNALAPNCHLWPVVFTKFFPHYLINGTIFEKKVVERKMYFDFVYKFCLKHFSF